ncbi:MAG: PAS domain S-box protein [Desulfobacteraceae bacterium]|nr:PAS domain S-box protein [Desulfobacteraceae bacterium]
MKEQLLAEIHKLCARVAELEEGLEERTLIEESLRRIDKEIRFIATCVQRTLPPQDKRLHYAGGPGTTGLPGEIWPADNTNTDADNSPKKVKQQTEIESRAPETGPVAGAGLEAGSGGITHRHDSIHAPSRDSEGNNVGMEYVLVMRELAYNNLLDNLPDMVVRYDSELRRIYVNPAWEKASGLSSEAILHLPLFDTPKTSNRIAPEYLERVRKVLAEGTQQSIEFTWENALGQLLCLRVVILPEYGRSGEIISALAIGHNLTEHKFVESMLRESEDRYRHIIDTANEGIWVMDAEHRTTYVNQAMAAMVGYTPSEMLGKEVEDFLFVEDMASFEQRRQERHAGMSEVYEQRFKRSNGYSLWTMVSAKALKNGEGGFCGSFAMLTDITGRRLAEEALRESEEKFRKIFLSNPDPIAMISVDEFRHIDVNDAFLNFIGLSRDEVIGKTTYELGMFGTQEVLESFRSAIKSRRVFRNIESNCKTRQGLKSILVSADIISLGQSSYILVLVKDITERERAEAERKRLESHLLRAQKVEAIGTLAGGIAHDFNNILAPIIGYAELGIVVTPDSTPLRYYLNQVLTAAHRAKELVMQILSLSRLGEQQPKSPIDISLILKESLKLLRASLPSSIQIKRRIGSGMAFADATQIHQVIINLCTNAAHAMEDKGTLAVSLEEGFLNSIDLGNLSLTDRKPGKYLKLSVTDTGTGMSAETMARIFDPYFTTKETGKGTGLGLAIVHAIVQNHSGGIHVISEPGKGSTFEVYIPAIDELMRTVSPSFKDVPRGSERILLVDDEPAIAEVSLHILAQLGYRVTTRMNPLEALDLFQSEPDSFDLIISDYTMPYMVGTELAKACMKIRNDIPVIICTGYSQRLSKEATDNLGIRAVAMKPLDRKQLAELIRKVLDDAKNCE